MDKRDIVDELDKLKGRIMLDEGLKSRDIDRYQEWVDEMNLKGKFSLRPWQLKSNERHSKYSLLKNCVDDLYGEKYGNRYDYHKNRPEIRKIIAEAVAMVMFYQEELDK